MNSVFKEAYRTYHQTVDQASIQASARQVDDGRVGQLSRMQELAGFIKDRVHDHAPLKTLSGLDQD